MGNCLTVLYVLVEFISPACTVSTFGSLYKLRPRLDGTRCYPIPTKKE